MINLQLRAERRFAIFLVLPLVFALAACASETARGPAEGTRTVAGAVATATTIPPTETPATSPTAAPALATPVPGRAQTTTTVALPSVDAAFDLSHYALHQGEALVLRGRGFAAGEMVRLQIAGSPAVDIGEAKADDRGEVVVPGLRIPALPEGEHTLLAQGADSGRQAARTISVIGFSPAVLLSSYTVRPGEAFGFTGSQFVPGEQVQVFLDGAETPLATFTAGTRGELGQQTLLQATPQLVGKHNLEFVGAQSGAHLPVAFEVLPFVPTMELTTYAGPPGSTVGFTGHGFAPGETIHAYLAQNNGRQELATFKVDGNGAFENAGQFTVPADAREQKLNLTVEGAESHVAVSQQFGVLALAPWVGLSAYSGPPGAEIDASGKGFAVGETVDVLLGTGPSAAKVGSAVADAQGDFQAGPLTIPADARGAQTLTFRGEGSGATATTEFTVIDTGGQGAGQGE